MILAREFIRDRGVLYPNGTNTRPAAHNAAGLDIARQVQPLDALGNPDTAHGKSVMIFVGMSNATQEFASKGNDAFKPRADSDLSKNPQLTIIDGAQDGKDAPAWLDPDAATWATVNQRVAWRSNSAAGACAVRRHGCFWLTGPWNCTTAMAQRLHLTGRHT